MGPRVSDTGTLTTVALVIIAVVAVLTVIAIAWGARLKRQRAEADRLERERVEAEGGDPHAAEDAGQLSDAHAVDVPQAEVVREPAPPLQVPATAPPPPDDLPAPDPIADEPIAAAAPLEASPATEAEPASAPTGPDLARGAVTQIKGLGPKVAARLAELGITEIGQLAALNQRAAEDLDAHLGVFTGRLTRDRWLEQAKLLAKGDVKGFEERFGKL